MPEERRKVTLSKAHCETPQGRALMDLLVELSADGNVTHEEMERLRRWLEVDRGVDFPALPFLYETIDQISSDGEISEEELDRLAQAIERALPKELRAAAATKRKEARDAKRSAQRESRRQSMIADRTERRAARTAMLARTGVLYRAEFAVRGAFRFSERRKACERLIDGDAVTLEREPDNSHDPNAILVLGENDCELGYVPREKAVEMAPLLDAGADAAAVVSRIWETPEGQVVPILVATLQQGDVAPRTSDKARRQRSGESSTVDTTMSLQAVKDNSSAVWFLAIGLLLIVLVLVAYYVK